MTSKEPRSGAAAAAEDSREEGASQEFSLLKRKVWPVMSFLLDLVGPVAMATKQAAAAPELSISLPRILPPRAQRLAPYLASTLSHLASALMLNVTSFR